MTQPNIQKTSFGTLDDGQSIEAWTLRGASGLEMEVLTYGGIVRRLCVPDKNGNHADVVLGYETLEEYVSDIFWFGATAGRIAGRVTQGKIRIDGREHQLPINEGDNHLHGGADALNRKVWTAQPVERPDGAPSLRLTLHSPDGDQGYPGAVDLVVTYTVTAKNEFIYETEASSDQATPISLTHHGYFNLAGHDGGNALDQVVQVNADSLIPFDEVGTLEDSLQSLDSTPSDLRQAKAVNEFVKELPWQHGDLYWLGQSDALRHVASVSHPVSGRTMGVHTDLPCLQLYFGDALKSKVLGKSGTTYDQYGAICFECEGFPNATTAPGFGDIVVRPGKPQKTTTVYAFGSGDNPDGNNTSE